MKADDIAERALQTAADEKARRDLLARERAKTAHAEATRRPAPTLIGYALPDLATTQFPRRTALLTRVGQPVLCSGQIGQLYAPRGVGKTIFAETLSYAIATGTAALGFSAPEPCRVLYVDGEMNAEEIQQRFADIALLFDRDAPLDARQARLFAPPPVPSLTVVAADWQAEYLPRLDTPEGQEAIEPFVAAADLVILDNRSCLFDPEGEKDPSAWQPAQDWLLSLRRRGKTVLVIHHSNRQGGARGHSKAEDVMDLILKLSRPEDYTADQGARFVVEFDKARSVHGPAAAPFTAALTPEGWQLEEGDHEDNAAAKKLREYMRVATAAADFPKSANAAIQRAQVNRNAGLQAWADLKGAGVIREHANGGYYLVDNGGAL